MCKIMGKFTPTKHLVILGEEDFFNQWFRIDVDETELWGSIVKSKEMLTVTIDNKIALEQTDMSSILAQSGLSKNVSELTAFTKYLDVIEAKFKLS